MDYAPDGMLRHNDLQIARAGEWTGDPKRFVESLISAEFLDREGGVLTVHDWLRFCGALMEKRLARKGPGAVRTPTGAVREPTNPTNQPNQPKEKPRFSDSFGEVKNRVAESITEKKHLPSPYSLTEKESEAVSQACARYRPEVVLACWEMWWFAGEGWSDWAFKCGHGITGFLSSSGIGAILDSKRWQGKAAAKKKELESVG